MLLAALHFVVALQARDTTAIRIPSDAYADPATGALVTRLRAARDRNERLVTRYTVTAKQRIGVGVRALSRDRMLYRSEVVVRIAWNRDTASTVEVVGAREGIPIATRGDRIPEELDDLAGDLVLNPSEDYLRLLGSDDDGFSYPLRPGGELDYRFATGDTTTISLPTGQNIRLVALKVTPRRSDWQLVTGTFWFDLDTDGLVRAVFRPARPFEFKRDISPKDRDDTPGWVNPGGEVKYITLEYGFYESRWWLPRFVAMDAIGTWGDWLNVPFRIERTYQDYEVEGGTPPIEGSSFRPAGTMRRRAADDSVTDQVERARIADSIRTEARACRDSARATPTTGDREIDRRARRAASRECYRNRSNANLDVLIPEDTLAMLASPELGAPILAMGDLINEDDLRGLAASIKQLPSSPWDTRVQLPDAVSSVLRPERFNRIESISLALNGRIDLGPIAGQGSARLGAADLVPNADLRLVRSAPTVRYGLGGYYRLAAANPETHPFGLVNSFTGFFGQRDDGEYFRTLGAELTAENTNAGWWSARAWYQRERPVEVGTQVSLPHLFNSERRFRPNIVADSATQAGVSLTFRGTRALSHTITLGGETRFDGATGDYRYGRGAATVRLFITPKGPLAGAVAFTAGTTTGDLPVQSLFYLGGAATLRGYDGGVARGAAYWHGRVEIGNSFPAARVTLFSDVGWAGERSQFGQGRPLIGAGVGGSFLDGLIRIDLAAGLRNPKGFRIEFYLDGIL
ncbi:MAG: hypothetical protein AAB075_10910 [Gemmatimonadota bacterium]